MNDKLLIPPYHLRLDRRAWLRWAAATAMASGLPGCQRTSVSEDGTETMRFPGKVAMRVINSRPPCLETPQRYYREDLTPNEAFYVRWHLQLIPTTIDTRSWRLKVDGHVDKPLEIALDELKRMEPTSIVAVSQCSGNSRALFNPNLTGAQWGNGAMGNARWTGILLKDLLAKAGLKAGAVDVIFAGLDRAGPPSVPDFVKSLPIDEARRPDILLAYEMNGQPLPLLNGFPLRLVVPGWYATYWVKALSDIRVLPNQFEGYWMAKAYRIPATPNALEEPAKLAEKTVPINRMNVRSFFTMAEPNLTAQVGKAVDLQGIAFDGGAGIEKVEVSTDSGANWAETKLGADLGRYSFRRWRWSWRPAERGEQILHVRATSTSGETQPATVGWNRAGFMRNVIETMKVTIA